MIGTGATERRSSRNAVPLGEGRVSRAPHGRSALDALVGVKVVGVVAPRLGVLVDVEVQLGSEGPCPGAQRKPTVGRPRCCRIFWAMGKSLVAQSTFILPAHLGQAETSTPKPCLSRETRRPRMWSSTPPMAGASAQC